MDPGCTGRLALFVVALLAATSARGGGAVEFQSLIAAQAAPTYTLRRTIDVGASSVAGFSAFDPVSGRAYAATPDGLFRFDMQAFERGERVSDLRFTGRLEFALDIGLLIAGLDGNRLAVLDATSYELVRTIQHHPWGSFVYEPDVKELYLFSLDRSVIDVIDPRTGQPVTTIRLPTWGAGGGIRVPGRIIFRIRDDVFTLDTLSKTFQRLPLPDGLGRLGVFADPSGRTLFATTDTQLLAFSSLTGDLTGVVNTGERAYATYDPVADVVLASVKPTGAQIRRLVIYRHGPEGFAQIGEQELPAFGQGPPQPTPFGFVNTGNAGDASAHSMHHRKLLVWDREMPEQR